VPAAVRKLSFPKRWAIRAGTILFRLVILTLRLKVTRRGQEFLASPPASGLFLIWHNRLAFALSGFSRLGKGIPLTGLVSASNDGAILAEIMHLFHVQTVRGSSSRRAMEATRELIAVLAAGRNVVITPDGPRGPVYTVKDGAAQIGRDHATAIYVFGFNCKEVWTIKSWDNFMFPKPFARLEMDVEKIETSDDCTAPMLAVKLCGLNRCSGPR
jgi:lysophospholipid acyltransferase (LPLAT)-like uncharacterized protein